MSRFVIASVTVALTALFPMGSLAAENTQTRTLTVAAPTRVELDTSTALEFRLPKNAAAVDGRILFDSGAAELLAVAPKDGGTSLTPVEIPGGAAFGAYGLKSSAGQTVLRVLMTPHVAGAVEVRMVIDSASDTNGRRLTTRSLAAVANLNVAGDTRFVPAAQATPRPVPLRAAVETRGLFGENRISPKDLDIVRAGWELARERDEACGADLAAYADANGDGCVDIVDIQALVAAQGARVSSAQHLIPAATTGAVERPSSLNAPAAFAGPIFTVNNTADTADTSPGNGICADSQGRCTLRAAITEANWVHGPARIEFQIAPGGLQTITVGTSPLPIVQNRNGGIQIDGYTQPGSSVNTAAYGSNAVLNIAVVGPGTTKSVNNPFRITSANNVIRGLAFRTFYRPIIIDGTDAQNNQIIGNWFGFSPNGTTATNSAAYDILLNTGSNHNIIGTPALADRNVIGRAGQGVHLYGAGTQYNVIQNNLFCMRPDGVADNNALCSTAVDHNSGPQYNITGGLGPNEGNIIGRTTLNGIELSHGWNPAGSPGQTDDTWAVSHNELLGNWVGFRHDGAYDAAFRSAQSSPGSGDNGNGINCYDGSSYNLIEGNYVSSVWDGIQILSGNSTGNVVRGNIVGQSPLGQAAPVGRYGIVVRNATKSNVIEGNAIRNTTSYGIGLIEPNVRWVRITHNIITNSSAKPIHLQPYANDPTTGANVLLARPVIASATTVWISGTGIEGATVEVYRADRAAGLVGLPTEYLGSAVVSGGAWQLPVSALAAGDRVTALQIATNDNTSELTQNVLVSAASPPQPPVADFAWGQRAYSTIVDFTDASTAVVTSRSWNFGDGTPTSSQQNPAHTYAAAGTYTVTLTATNQGGSDSEAKQISVSVPPPLPPGGLFAADSFSRSLGSGWGDADVGGAYSLQVTAGNYNTSQGVGDMIVPAAGNTRSAILDGISEDDVDISFRVKVDKIAAGGSYLVYAVVRRNGSNEYRPRILLTQTGTVQAHASAEVNGVETAIGSTVTVPGLAQIANTYIRVRAQVTGQNPTTIRVKAWADGTAEPAAWNYTGTDSTASLQVPGALGLRSFVGSAATTAPVTFGFDDFVAKYPAPTTPVASFTSSQAVNTLDVAFSDTSTGSIDSWSWDFGDGATSTDQNPSHTYAAAGDYLVSLTVANLGGADGETHTVTVAPLLPAPVYASDSFERTVSNGWGTADTGGPYAASGTLSNYSVGSGAGSIVVNSAGNSRSVVLGNVNQQNVHLTFRVRVDKVASGGAYFVYAVTRRNGTSEYRPRIVMNANGTVSVQASSVVNNSESAIGSAVVVPGLMQTVGGYVWVRAEVVGTSPTTIRVKAWADGDAEPAAWQYTATNSAAALQTSGSVGLRVFVASAVNNAPVTFTFDDYEVFGDPGAGLPPPPTADFTWQQVPNTLTVDFADASSGGPTGWSWDFGDSTTSTLQNPSKTYAAAGTYTVQLTATNAGGATSTTKWVTVVPTGPPTYAADAFGRTVNGGWGTADTGGSYTLTGNTANFSVAGGMGSIVLPNAGAGRAAILGGVSQLDLDITFRVQVDKVAAGGSYYVYAVSRQNGNNEYRPRLILNANGTVSVSASMLVSNSETGFGSVVVPGLTQIADSFIWVHTQVTGTNPTTIRVKAWADGSPEPTSWQFTATNSSAALQTAGAVGFRVYLGGAVSNSPVTFKFDDFLVKGL
ncbi:MAG: PKD domain-containing protein [Chloroflexota bacterium]